ncbi:hypothetical protein A4H97_17900, partial [Niastella yeongjuensis]
MIINEMMDLFWNHTISEEEILSSYRNKVTYADFKTSLETANQNKDKKLLKNTFFVGFWFDFFDEGTGTILKDLILGNWHSKHEDIAGIFQRIFHTEKESIPVLLKAIDTIPEYLQQEDYKYPYIRKLIYAIGAQPEMDNIEALKKLAQSDDEQIIELALHQIKKRGELGRWDQVKFLGD